MILIDGKKTAKEIREELRLEVEEMKKKGCTPGLKVIIVGEDPASHQYVRNKQKAAEKIGMNSETIFLDKDVSQEELNSCIKKYNEDHDVHGILVQFPLPKHLSEKEVILTISPEKDVDCFHPANVGKMMIGDEDGFEPCTPAGVVELLSRYDIDPQGKHVVIIGRSNLVGKPLSALLIQKKKMANATVTVCHSRTKNIEEYTKEADILVAAMGYAKFVKEDMVKEGVIVVDVGTNQIDDPSAKKGYRFVGDVDFEAVSQKAHAITPVPGGVGPMTIAMLMKNTVTSAKAKM